VQSAQNLPFEVVALVLQGGIEVQF
jgi:hypothetical protein